MPSNTKYELALFHDFIKQILSLNPQQLENFFKQTPAEQLIKEFTDEGIKILHNMKHAHCVLLEEYRWNNYLLTHGQECLNLLDDIQQWRQKQDAEDLDLDWMTLCDVLIVQLGLIANYVKTFKRVEFIVPLGIQNEFVKFIRQQGILLQKEMISHHVDLSLQEVILDYVEEFCSFESFNYLTQDYMTRLMTRMLGVFKATPALDWNMRIAGVLIYLNFNTLAFIEHCWNYILADVDQQINLKDQELKFRWRLKEILKLDLMEEMYKHRKPSVIKVLQKKINCELQHMETLKNTLDCELPRVDFRERTAEADEWIYSNDVMEALGISLKTLYNYNLDNVFEVKDLGDRNTKIYSKRSVMRVKQARKEGKWKR